MRGRGLFVLACAALLLAWAPSAAFAQDDAASGASVVILKFERFDADDAAVDAFKKALEQGIEAHDGMHVKSGGEVTIQDLALTAGCEKPDAQCLGGLRDFVDADRVVFGSIQRSDDVYLFSLKMFDFAEGRFIHELSDQTIEGGVDKLEEAAPALVDAFLYGDVGVVQVNVEGAESPEIYFDGEKVGLAPTKLENLPLGQHVVSLKTSDGQEKSQTLLLRHDQPASLDFSFGGGSDVVAPPEEQPATGGPSAVPGYVSLGVGVAGFAMGAYSSLQVKDASDSSAAIFQSWDDTGRLTASGDSLRGDDKTQQAVASDVQTLQDNKQRAQTFQTLQWVGYSVGAVGLLVGGYFLYRAFSYEAPPEDVALNDGDSDFTFGVAPTSDGVAAGFAFRF